MFADSIRHFYEHHFWANERILAYAEHVSAEDFVKPREYSVGSLCQQFVHTALAEMIWFSNLEAGQVVDARTIIPQREYHTLADVRELYEQVKTLEKRFLANLQDSDLSRTILRQRGDVVETRTFWQILLQMHDHATDHRAQMLVILHEYGAPTGEQGFFAFLREEVTS